MVHHKVCVQVSIHVTICKTLDAEPIFYCPNLAKTRHYKRIRYRFTHIFRLLVKAPFIYFYTKKSAHKRGYIFLLHNIVE